MVATTGDVLLVALGEIWASKKPVSGRAPGPAPAFCTKPVRFAEASIRREELKNWCSASTLLSTAPWSAKPSENGEIDDRTHSNCESKMEPSDCEGIE